MPNSQPQKPRKRRGVVGVIVREERVLVIQRSAFVRSPLQWCFPGGGVELGETDEQALVRELEEELAVVVEPLHLLWRNLSATKFDLSWWQAEMAVDAIPIPNSAEVATVCWLTIHELKTLPDLLASNRDFIAAWEQGAVPLRGINGLT